MRKILTIAALGTLFLASCSETKYVAEGQYLLDRVEVKTDQKAPGINTSEMKSYVRQRGNSRWFTAIKVPLRTYSLSGADTSQWINRTLRSMGEAPELFDTLLARQSVLNLQSRMQNLGYLQATVDVQNRLKGKKVTTTYMLHPGRPYYVRNFDYDIQDSAIARLLEEHEVTTEENRKVRSGMMFNADNLDAERKRLVEFLTNRGYYRFNKDFISYRADSTAVSGQVDLTLVLHRYRDNTVSDVPHQQYTIGHIGYRSGNLEDSLIHLRPRVLRNNTFLTEGELYAARGLQSTYNHFGRLGAVRYTNISFQEHAQLPVLDCNITLSTNKPSTIAFQPEGTNTAGDLGAAASLTYQNRNLFRGSELLTIELRGAYEAIRGLEGYSNQNFVEYSLETKLTFPRFIAPFLASSFRRRINATSEVSLMYDRQNRPEFRRRVFSVAWRYRWNDQRHHDRYQIDLLDLNYISMPWISETFRREYLDDTSSRNAILRYNYENLFIMKVGFGYTYNNGIIAIKAKAETAGNLLRLASDLFSFHRNSEGQYTFMDLAYAQYAKGDFDFTRNFQLDNSSQLVMHIGLGIAYPYGNSTVLPFEKRYFSGGANSVRGWSVRSLGPGKYVGRDGRIDFINQTGDMKLDMNVEYRTKLFWKFGAALFVDAGNIWTLREYDEQPGGQFRLKDFLNQLAVSYGLGIRLNFDYFILRFDMGMKAVNPAYETRREHYPLLYPQLSRDFAFHFAVGLPF
ncbi:MAG: BamA/TamA family outer membrane protein [Prevotella sp.]|nr:BamA/TamA family outer membrane protein [Prevotella sp.]